MEESDRVCIAKHESEECWKLITNPRIDFASTACNNLLINSANDYAEYKNCGVLHRMIRYKDIGKYGIEKDKVNSSNSVRVVGFETEK